MPRIRYSEAVRQRAVRLVLDSQMPVAQVAREIGCSVNTVHLWLKERKSDSKSSPSEAIPQEETATFIPVNLIDQKPATVEIVTPNGFTIRLNDSNSQFIVELLSELASC